MTHFKWIIVLTATIVLVLASSCNQPQEKGQADGHEAKVVLASTGNFGAPITKDGAVDASQVAALVTGDEPVAVTASGTIAEVCQHSGCWLTFDLGNGQTMQVNMKDHAYAIPKDAAGKKVWVKGTAMRELITVDMLKHYAEDAGKSQEYIDAITQDEWQYTIEADGVIIE